MDDPIPYVKGDATEDDVLIAAGIERAAGLIAALPSDADNVFIALTAKGINRDIQVVACAERPAHGDDGIKASYCRLC
ncbi:NAD-binding protein [Anoxybacillus kestanbolensis]|uniref:NAD-binding protein n=1 Tax=Anoxybacillus kestanbolensis TaxID=227476 RepID=UPI001E540580|nr:NAD-binding protein [Anoxybacillus kestanbolensis]